MPASAKVTGWKELAQNVRELQDRISRGAMRTSLTKAARLTTASAKRKAPRGRTGLLKKSIRQKIVTKVKKNLVIAVIGASTRVSGVDPLTKKTVKPARYAHLVEMGTAARGVYGRKGVSITPGNPPKPFLRPALEETKTPVKDKFRAEMKPAIEATAARIYRQKTRRR